MKELVELLVKNIVDEPKAVKIKEERDSAGDKIILRVADEDMGKVIGKNGRIIKAIRSILRIKATKENRRVYLELAEQNKPTT